jgi:hypothetical protein
MPGDVRHLDPGDRTRDPRRARDGPPYAGRTLSRDGVDPVLGQTLTVPRVALLGHRLDVLSGPLPDLLVGRGKAGRRPLDFRAAAIRTGRRL